MLMEEERFVAEANNAAKLSAEIAHWQKEAKKSKVESVVNQSAYGDRSNETSVIIDKKRTEPLITKAYNAFRKTSKQIDIDNLVPTETYLDE